MLVKHDIGKLSDPFMSLADWRKQIDSLIKQYGKDAKMGTDAGYNNVSFFVEVEKE